eukprot:TRINITY_DN7573_c0_g1_i1.p1 TRINITY_DN7573_c0_g1~~TRINITY_DN7573_c0_g1_i1.p1  ORF type:complete len:107 (+),score=7.45 TRINITY_DN7573_c0_g1_i1:236-556(+)
MHYDVFNGDADGIIALLQLRLAAPKDSTLITGVKRDISLLKQVDVSKATAVTVLDISLGKNIKRSKRYSINKLMSFMLITIEPVIFQHQINSKHYLIPMQIPVLVC